MMRIANLMRKFNGPVLIIGGGPSVRDDLLRLTVNPVCTISANEHGFHQQQFDINFICTGSQHHWSGAAMRPLLQSYGVPIIGRHDWADYRIDWKFRCNSGLTAIAVAAFLGGDPIIVTGIDCYAGETSYFHCPGRHSTGHDEDYGWQLTELVKAIPQANVRALSGPIADTFGRLA